MRILPLGIYFHIFVGSFFSLAFGIKTDFNMLKTLSLQNYGFARKIYTASDASLQLEGIERDSITRWCVN
jgi:hypothetical protein